MYLLLFAVTLACAKDLLFSTYISALQSPLANFSPCSLLGGIVVGHVFDCATSRPSYFASFIGVTESEARDKFLPFSYVLFPLFPALSGLIHMTRAFSSGSSPLVRIFFGLFPCESFNYFLLNLSDNVFQFTLL